MESGTQQSADPQVRFAPRLTEDSLPVTLPKDADKIVSDTSASDQTQAAAADEDKPVSAGVLDLQLIPQVNMLIRLHSCSNHTADQPIVRLTSYIYHLQLREVQIKNQQLQQLLQQKDTELLALQ